MKNKETVSRRDFLQVAGTLSGAAYLKLTTAAIAGIAQAACSAEQASAPFTILGDAEAADFAAIAARIIPTTATPGANEAGVIYFFDQAFADAMRDQLADARRGLAELNASIVGAGASVTRVSQLSESEQDALLKKNENSDFFNLAWEMTIFGFFAMSKYGGNKDHVSWDLIGFEGHHGAWTYPFGYYDAEYAKEQSGDE